VKVAAIQHDICWEDGPATCARLGPWLDAAAAQGARLAVLTEMFPTGFSADAARISEPIDGPSTDFLRVQAARTGMAIGGSIATNWGTGRPRNTFTLVMPDGVVHRYDKLHPFSYAGEHERFDSGTDRITIDVDGLRVTPFVCYDLRFANAFWDMAERTDVYVVVASWPEARREHWMALLRARAIENQAYVVGVNRVGEGGKVTYSGDSRIIDPLGVELVTAQRQESLLVADIDPSVVADVRRRYPFLADRRDF
jgi:predicted amidohydrolase